MNREEALLWMAAGTLALLVVALAWNLATRTLRRRARRRWYEEALAQERRLRRASLFPGAQRGSIRPEAAEAVRKQAEAAARRVAGGSVTQVQNPHAKGTPEFVLWITTYHIALNDLAEDQRTRDARYWQTQPPVSDR